MVGKDKSGPETVQLKIELIGTNPLVWRRIQVLANSTLRSLYYAICESMEWTCSHLYIFKVGEELYGDSNLDVDFEGWGDDSKIKVGRVAKKFSEIEFVYDFGDDWHHRVIVEDLFQGDFDERYPVCVAGENAAPPEDCGGVGGFEEFKKSVKSGKHKEPRNVLSAIKIMDRQTKDFDPTFFSLILINEVKLMRRKPPSHAKGRAGDVI